MNLATGSPNGEMDYPAISSYALSVAAVYDSNLGYIDYGSGHGPVSATIPVEIMATTDRLTSFSGRHTELLDIAAPGAFISSPDGKGGTVSPAGTSFAAPFVTGAVALLQQANQLRFGNKLESDRVRDILRYTGDLINDSVDSQPNSPNVPGTFDDVANTDGVFPRLNAARLIDFVNLEADFDFDGQITANDIDILYDAVNARYDDIGSEFVNAEKFFAFDINNDGDVNQFDVDYLIFILLETFYGDSNLDGSFDSGDLVVVFVAGEYEDMIVGNSGWAEGEWNGNEDFDSADFVFVFVFDLGGYSGG